MTTRRRKIIEIHRKPEESRDSTHAINPNGRYWMLGPCSIVSVEVVQARGEAVTVGRVREALGKDFGDALNLVLGRERTQAVEEVSPGYLWRMLTLKTFDLTAVVTRGEDGRKGLVSMTVPQSSWW